MSTSAIVAAEGIRSGRKGKYIHSDGYPDVVGHELVRIVRQLGFEEASRELVLRATGWSFLTEAEDALHVPHSEWVPSVGYRYTDHLPTHNDWLALNEGNWGYVLHPDVIDVWREGQVQWRMWINDDEPGRLRPPEFVLPTPIHWRA